MKCRKGFSKMVAGILSERLVDAFSMCALLPGKPSCVDCVYIVDYSKGGGLPTVEPMHIPVFLKNYSHVQTVWTYMMAMCKPACRDSIPTFEHQMCAPITSIAYARGAAFR